MTIVDGAFVLLHKSMKTSGKSSYFLADAFNLLLMCAGTAHVPALMVSNFQKMQPSMFEKLMRSRKPHGASPAAPRIQSWLRDLFTSRLRNRLVDSGAGSCYEKDKSWWMMLDIASIKNAHASTSFLVIPAFRTHGNGLGDAVTNISRTANDHAPSCPWCRAPILDDACHAVSCCTHPRGIAIRKLHTSPLLTQMKLMCPSWHSRFQITTSHREKAKILLNAACYEHMQELRRPWIILELTHLLCELRKAHPTFSKYSHGANIESLCYY